jgi:ABC-type transport system substrate-binding protein
MRRILLFFLSISIAGVSRADTEDFIKANLILLKSNFAYFDVGEKEGVKSGESFEIYYDQRVVVSGKIGWADQNISRTEPLNDFKAAELANYGRSLTAKIRLYVAEANRGGHLNIAYFSNLNLEPSRIVTPEDMMVARLIHRGLLTKDTDGKIVPDLCGDYEIRDLTYTFYLSPDAKFHTGRSVESADVLYSFEQLAAAPKLTNSSSFVLEIEGAEDYRNGLKSEIAGIFIIDKKTVSITLRKPFPAFEEYLAGPGGYIIPKPGVVSTSGTTIGTGSYMIKWRDSDFLVLEPFDSPGQSAYLDSLRFVRYANVDEAGLSFELGHLDMINLLGETSPKFVTHGNFTSQSMTTNSYIILGLNNSRQFQQHEYLGKAISFLLDRDSMIRVILGGSAARPFFRLSGQSDQTVALSAPFMPDSAQNYLDSISTLPQSLTLYVDTAYPALTKIASYIEGQLLNKGIKTVEKKTDFMSLDKLAIQSDMDLYLTCFVPISDTFDCVFYPLFSDSLLGQTNYLYYHDEAAQTFLDDLHSEIDNDRRDNLTYGLAQSFAYDPPAVFLYQPFFTSIMKTDISGLIFNPAGFVDFRHAYIEMDK